MDFQQQQHGYMRQQPPPPPPPPQMSMPADPYHHQSQRFPVPPPNPWYSTQFHYPQTSPSPPPPPPLPPPSHAPPQHHQQWGPAPPHSDHYAPPPPPPAPYPGPTPYAAHHPAPHNQYPPPPPPHPHQLPPLPPRPPHVQPPQVPQSYPQVNQDWGNANWSHHQSWEYQANNNEEVWAAKARAWAAAKVASDNQQTQHLQYPTNEGSLAADSIALYHGRDSSISPSVHQQEVPSSYSSIAGDTGRGIDPMAAMPSDYAFVPPAEPPLVYPSVPAVIPSGPQVDHSAVIPSPVSGHSAPIFGRMAGSSFQATISSVTAPFGIGSGPELHPMTTFPGDSYGVISERPKKASVPNWLREEIIKKKPAIVSSAQDLQKEDAQSTEDEVGDKSYAKGDQADSKSIASSRSTEDDDDDEDEVEAARAAAINQEIKRVLTEVLLKVTDELFDEIATKVLNEDDSALEVDHIAATSDHNATISAPPIPSSIASAKVLVPIKDQENNSHGASENSASIPPVNVLGLANYASEDDEEGGEIQSSGTFQKENTSLQHSASSKFLKGMDVVGNGNSQEETREDPANHVTTESVRSVSTSNVSAINDSALINESDKKRASNTGDSLGQETRNTSNKDDRRKDESKFGGKEQKTKELHADKERTHERGSESRSRHDERHKKEKKMNQNGSKDRVPEKSAKSAEKAKDSGSRKRPSPDFVKEGRKERQTDKSASGKEDSGRKRGRGRERERDDKREKIRHTNASESTRHMRHRSSSVSSKGRDNKDGSGTSDSSNDSSDNSKRRLHSRRDKSASTARSMKRQVLRSPHSKHSQRRHSPPYPSLESSRRRRSRSRSPVRRRR